MADQQDRFSLNHILLTPAFKAALKRIGWKNEVIMAGIPKGPVQFSAGKYLLVYPDARAEHGWQIMWVETN